MHVVHPHLILGCALTTLLLMPLALSAGEGMSDTARLDLEGMPLASAPNPTSPREGKPPGILSFTTPNLQLHRTSLRPSKGTILLFPGGGYHMLAIEHEGLAIAALLNAEGYDVAILEYSIGKEDTRAQALADATKALALIQKKGNVLGLNTDSLGVMGFSAGGHLACRLVHELGAASPFSTVILIYPAYLEGEGESPEGIKAEVAPPRGVKSRVFVLIGEKDKPEWVSSAAAYAEACKEIGYPSEYHLLPGTGHGFGIQSGQLPPVSDWPKLLGAFLKGSGS